MVFVKFLHVIQYNYISLRYNLIYSRTMAKINRLKVVLVENEKSGKWLADQLGKSTCTVSKWCSNTTQPDLQTLSRISEILEVNIKDLLVDNKE